MYTTAKISAGESSKQQCLGIGTARNVAEAPEIDRTCCRFWPWARGRRSERCIRVRPAGATGEVPPLHHAHTSQQLNVVRKVDRSTQRIYVGA